jgi:hypothetical protein
MEKDTTPEEREPIVNFEIPKADEMLSSLTKISNRKDGTRTARDRSEGRPTIPDIENVKHHVRFPPEESNDPRTKMFRTVPPLVGVPVAEPWYSIWGKRFAMLIFGSLAVYGAYSFGGVLAHSILAPRGKTIGDSSAQKSASVEMFESDL